jgi:Sulfite exporter TauE/SafE.
MIGIVTFTGTIIYLYNGYVDLPLSFLTSLGIILGSYLGSTLMLSIKEEYQRNALVFLLVIVSFSMIYRGINENFIYKLK